MNWPALLALEEWRVTGPDDEFDDETNGDPDSMLGEDDEAGFDEMADYPDEPLDDDGFDDAGPDQEGEDDEGEENGEEEDE